MMTHTQGPVPLDSDVYIARQLDTELLRSTMRGDSVLLLGQRQHGKTSALLRYRETLKSSGFLVAVVDFQTLPHTDDFETLLEYIAIQIHGDINRKDDIPKENWKDSLKRKIFELYKREVPAPKYKNSFEDWLSSVIPDGSEKIVIIIDEAASIKNDGMRNSLYGQIRALTNARAAAPENSLSSRLIFTFAGAFRPECLVDEANSPFNTCRELATENFSLEQVTDLCRVVLGRDDESVVDCIWQHVGGQPFLVQKILSEIESASEDEMSIMLEGAIERLDEDTQHIRAILSKVIEDASLINIVSRILDEGAINLAPADADMKYLRTLGLVKRDEGKLVFANAYYRRMAEAAPQLAKLNVPAGAPKRTLFELPDEEFKSINNQEYREIISRAHRGGVVAYNANSFRLALTAFGSAFEGVLIDWLRSQASNSLQSGISSANPSFNTRYEDSSKPETWRLVNLIKVGRAIAPGLGIAETDVPDVIREWRNYVHPEVLAQNFVPEHEFEAQAVAAESLFRIALKQLN